MLRRMLSRTLGVTRWFFRAAVRLPFVAVRRHWKAGLLAVLVLNLLFTISGLLERRFTPPLLIPVPPETFSTQVEHGDLFWTPQNPYCHYVTALSLVDRADTDLFSEYWLQRHCPPTPPDSGLAPPDPSVPLPDHKFAVESPSTTESRITEAQVERAIRNLQPAIEALRNGAERPVEKLRFPLEDHRITSLGAVEVWRLGRLLGPCGLAASRAIEAGCVDEGIRLLLDFLEAGSDFTHSETYYIGWSLRKGALTRIAALVGSGHLKAGHYRKIIGEVVRLEEEKADYRSILEREYMFTRDLLVGFLDMGYYDADYRQMAELHEYWEFSSPWIYFYKSIPGMRTWVLRNHSRAWKRILDTQTKPFPTAMAVWHEVLHKPEPWLCDHYLKDRLTPRLDFVNKVFASGTGFRSSLVAVTSDDLRARGLMLIAALEAHRLERGCYPESLDALVGGYLPSVPTDPFTDGKPFKYSLEGGEYLLYSVGPDMKDDGGKANPFYIVEDDYVGDLILGPGADLWKND